MARRAPARWWWCLLLALGACKVPIDDVNAGFALADATWFEAEQTLFFFYRVEAEQGLGPESVIEITYRTDDVAQPWVDLSSLPPVHTHLPVDCGVNARCGSMSLKVEKPPRDVALRLRYHRAGELSLQASPTTFNIVGAGAPATQRSLVLYGVFDESNTRVQWRARHQFPTLRNQQVQELGLRRLFRVLEPQYGDLSLPGGDNPYGYGFQAACPGGLTPLGCAPVETAERARFADESLPLAASPFGHLCARSIVTDATGTFETAVVAQKNPEVRPAFPSLRSPVRDDTPVGFLLKPCTREISATHQAMQVQRLQLESSPTVCIDDWQAPGFATTLASTFRTRLDQVRADGHDMVLTVALHHDDATGHLAAVVEDALEQVLPLEQLKSTPRVTGAFVFDSYAHSLGRAGIKPLVLWCPANLPSEDLDTIPDTASRSCPLLPDLGDLQVLVFKFSNLPILPTRAQYLTFIGKYSEAQAGKTTELKLRAPERTPVSQNVSLGEFGVATFFNNETLSAAPTDAFSFCSSADLVTQAVVFETPLAPTPVPLAALPQVHNMLPQPTYSLGLAWDFPFLVRLKYEVVVAGSVSAFSLTVPFGISSETQKYYGTELWNTEAFALADVLAQCTRFCDAPTFDSGGVYDVGIPFRAGFQDQCYRPLYPALDGGGFPLDP